jgi:death-on-curing protein
MRHLTLVELLELHRRILEATGGAQGLRDLGALESSLARPPDDF